MYYEDRLIDGILHYRNSPMGEFVAYDIRTLSRLYTDLQHEVQRTCDLLMADLGRLQ